MDDVRERLEKYGYIYIEPQIQNGKTVRYYGLGPNGINLISAWETERLTKYAVILSLLSLLVAVTALAISLKVV